jgi:signal transduction histidine kinase
MASHELKTPLTTLKGSAQLLSRQLKHPELDRERLLVYADRLQVQMNRMEQLVADLLDISRIQRGRLDLRPAVCDLREIAKDVVARCEDASERNEHHRFVLRAPEPVCVIVDPIRIDQALTNLVTNAVKYSPDGGTIQLTVGGQNGHAVLAVSDQGIGISPADQKRLFQPFARSDTVRGTVSGSGLGLHITREIIEQHGGRITVDSEIGTGSTFTIRLPVS